MRLPRFAVVLCLCIFMCIVCLPFSSSATDEEDSSPKLFLRNKQVDPVHGSLEPVLLPSSENTSGSSTDSGTQSAAPSFFARLFSFASPVVVEEQYNYYIVQFSGPLQSGWKESVSALGGKFYDYIPQYAFIVKAGESKVDSIRALDFVRYIGEYAADLKLSDGIYDITSDTLQEQGGKLDVRVVVFPGEDVPDIGNEIVAAGGQVVSSSSSEWNSVLTVRIPVAKVSGLKDIFGVKWIERAPKHRTGNNISTGISEIRSEQSKTWPVSGTRLLGKGQIVGACDSGIDTGDSSNMHLDFSDGQGGTRVIGYVTLTGAEQVDYSGHGTHVAGIMCGNGLMSGASPATNSFPSTCYAGVAPKAEIYFQSAGVAAGNGALTGIPSDLNELFQPAYDAGVRIHTNSWGTSGVGDYSSESLNVDQFMWSNKDFLVLYAVGNAGYDKDMNGVIDKYCIDTPATAKNCLSVGASESYRMAEGEGFSTRVWSDFRTYADPVGSDLLSDKPYGIAAFSSRGPTIDGRYKPEIVAPGTNILSTRASQQLGNGWGAFNQYYYWSGGTSMATPLVAGTAAIMREYLMKEEGFSNPSAALIKTALVHGAVSLVPGQYGTGDTQEVVSAPDFVQGWGRLDFEASINSDSSYKINYYDITDSAPAATGYSRTFSFQVENDEEPFKATLGWTDYPGTVAAAGGLVNDLDLRVKKPDGIWVYPDNAVNSSPLTKVQLVSSVNGFYTGEVIGLHVTPPSYPCTLESVVLAFYNSGSLLSPVSVVVYKYDGGVGDEIFRKSFAYIPSGEYALPVGLDLTDGSIVISVEKSSEQLGVYYQNGNPTARGLIKSSGIWQEASVTPGLIANFRTTVPSTGFDRLNNTVSVTVAKPQSGTYTVEVTAYNIPNGPQPYALVVSGMTGETPTKGDIGLNPDQPGAPVSTFLSKTSQQQSAQSVNAGYGTAFEDVYSQESSFRLQTSENGTVSVRYAVDGLPAVKAGELGLSKLYSNGTNKPFTYAGFEDYSDGNWWLTDVSGGFLDSVTSLNATTTYYVVSVVKDGGLYDENPEVGIIDDPQILGLSSSGGASGCVIGSGDDYGSVLLLFIAVFSLLLRMVASEKAKRRMG
ncbi:S8 family serine peptidase [Maridesulfovibrio sp. FT414]|uniref:S8 family serine peptidase n=1 Tax=Maridesulfovibrio sp. FT414 TaxID=2979469 RepID=UPI003D803377